MEGKSSKWNWEFNQNKEKNKETDINRTIKNKVGGARNKGTEQVKKRESQGEEGDK